MSDRQESDPPLAIEKWGWKHHHLGVPTENAKNNETYLPHLKFSLSGFNIIVEPNAPISGVRLAMIEYDGALIELMESK